MPGLYDDFNVHQMANEALAHGIETVSSLILELERSIENDYRYLKRRERHGRRTETDGIIAKTALAKALAVELLRSNLLILQRLPGMLPVDQESLRPGDGG